MFRAICSTVKVATGYVVFLFSINGHRQFSVTVCSAPPPTTIAMPASSSNFAFAGYSSCGKHCRLGATTVKMEPGQARTGTPALMHSSVQTSRRRAEFAVAHGELSGSLTAGWFSASA